MAELLQRIGSAEIAEWAAEYMLRNKDEAAAYERAREEAESDRGR